MSKQKISRQKNVLSKKNKLSMKEVDKLDKTMISLAAETYEKLQKEMKQHLGNDKRLKRHYMMMVLLNMVTWEFSEQNKVDLEDLKEFRYCVSILISHISKMGSKPRRAKK
jgi:hypothetical protein